MTRKYQLQNTNGCELFNLEMLRFADNVIPDVVRITIDGEQRIFRHFAQNLHGGSDILVFREATVWDATV